jgi:NAD(P)-dependent dehydrogenase (short-subunit alcohol dehydrogenase family)
MSKVLLITGGSRGIGAATALLAVKQGYAIAVNYQSEKTRADGVVAEVVNAGGTAIAVQGDVRRPEDIVRMFNETEAQLGKITHVINSAGITGKSSRLVDAPLDVIRDTIEINLMGTIHVCREAVKRMSTRLGGLGGVIVNLSSGAATLGGPNEFVWYAASKGAIDTLTLGLGREVADEGIRVCALAPGLTETEMHALSTGESGRIARMAPSIPMKRAAHADEVARSILFLLSDDASYITATTLRVAGGR